MGQAAMGLVDAARKNITDVNGAGRSAHKQKLISVKSKNLDSVRLQTQISSE